MQMRIVPIGAGWARNQINTVIFRRSALISHATTQYVAYYDAAAHVVLARRQHGSSHWEVVQTGLTAPIEDAHKSISLAVDGDGFLHVAWGHHNTPLQYCRSVAPGSLELGPAQSMTGEREQRLTYPEFYGLPDGNLLFLYRDGMSGNGDLLLNRYDCATRSWQRAQSNLISGEGERNAYWQMATDANGAIHLSWVWRETPDVATNHDMCYAVSRDGGATWQTSSGQRYELPITQASAEYAWRIPQGSDLINQTSMWADRQGRPYIATYFRPPGSDVPQYQLVFHDGHEWHVSQVGQRTTPFSLGGRGTRRVPISRPQLVVAGDGAQPAAVILFRDVERGERVSASLCEDLRVPHWTTLDLSSTSVGMWEPTYDPVVWNTRRELHILVQFVGQGDGEGVEDIPPQIVSVLEWTPFAPQAY